MEFAFEQHETVDDITKVPEQFRPLYVEADDGYALDEKAKPVAQAIDALNKANGNIRKENKTLKNSKIDLGPLKDFGEDPQSIREAIDAKIGELEGQIASGKKVDVEKIKNDLAESYKGELSKREERINKLSGSIDKYLRQSAAVSAIASEKGDPELLLPFVLNQTKVVEDGDEYKVVVVDSDGDARISPATGKDMTMEELVREMKSNAKYQRLFESEAPAGGGMPPGQKTKQTSSTQRREDMTSVDKIKVGLGKGQYVQGRGGR